MSTILNDLASAANLKQTFSPQTYDQNVDGQPVDLVASDGRAFAVLLLGPFGGGTTLAAKLQESSDQITFVDVPNGAFATFATGSNTHLLGFTRTRRYVRMRFDISGSADACAAIGQQRKEL
jgi:hypothetical protein